MPEQVVGTQTIIRNMIMDFIDVSDTTTPEYIRMGTGYTSLDENPNAQAESRPYISDRTASNIIRGYEAQFPFTADLIASERTIMKLYAIGRNQKQAGAAEVSYLRVEAFLPLNVANNYPARLFRCAVEISDTTGEGTQILEMSGNLNQVGDFIPGVFDVSTRTFKTMEEWVADGNAPLVDNMFLPEGNGVISATAYGGARTKSKLPVDND